LSDCGAYFTASSAVNLNLLMFSPCEIEREDTSREFQDYSRRRAVRAGYLEGQAIDFAWPRRDIQQVHAFYHEDTGTE